jgi:7-cyano-7-deazaguanine reductase
MSTNLTDIAAKTLGSSASYAVYTEQFDPSLLNPMPRHLARDGWGIKDDMFVGFDTWHCHEATFLLNNGVPVAGTVKFVYPADSEFMVESKSAKLYMNSFDMCKMGDTIDEAIKNYENQITTDLTNVIGREVKVKFFKSGSVGLFPLNDYTDLYDIVNKTSNIEITDYSAKENHLKFIGRPDGGTLCDNKYFTNALRSRCRHTKQKDTGAAYINIITKGTSVDPISLFKQIVSLREVNEFHEFCAEKLLTSIMEHEEVVDCVVTLLYSRRGSLDINPSRASNKHLLPKLLKDTNVYTEKAMGQ